MASLVADLSKSTKCTLSEQLLGGPICVMFLMNWKKY